MQPTRNQVEQSLAALIRRVALAGGAGAPAAITQPTDVADALSSLPEGLLAQLEQTIDIRADRLDRAREQLAHLDELTADDLADRIVGRLVCDRLR